MADNDRTESDHQLLMLYRISRSSAWIAFFTLVIAAGIAVCAYLFQQQMTAMQTALDDLGDLSGKVQQSLDVANRQSITMTKVMQSIAKQIKNDTKAANRLAAGVDGLHDAATKSMQTIADQIKSNTNAANQLAAGVERLNDLGNSIALMKLARPWVGVERISFTPLRLSQPFKINALIRNGGRSPAMDVRMTFSAVMPATNAVSMPQLDKCRDCDEKLLMPGATTTDELSIDRHLLSADEIKRIQTGTDKIMVFGRIDYSDPADRGHSTTVCMFYAPKVNAFEECPSGNRFE